MSGPDASQAPFAILIATCRRSASLERSLESLGQCHIPESLQCTRIIENGERCGSEAVVHAARQRYPQLKLQYLFSEPANKCHALNQGLRGLDGHFIYFTDDDIRFEPHVLDSYVAAAAGQQHGWVYGGPLQVDASGRPDVDLLPYMPASMLGFPGMRSTDAPKRFIGNNWAAFADDIKAAGGYDVRFGPGSDAGATGNETSMMRALRAGGCRFRYLPEALVHHAVDFSKIDEPALLKRRHRGGVERGLRLALNSRGLDSARLAWLMSYPRLLWQKWRLGSQPSGGAGRRRLQFEIEHLRGVQHGWRYGRREGRDRSRGMRHHNPRC